ncbi:substrate-binding periplasmic protein [Aquipseudomonas guryensis]|jgi:polar amino acid transport system substrate-binding protein|uniref:Transporter substrate-binding domain-containing protein n=1 Tax=Aquipseudomonas guryensis TaxID=2759165 RepID=A0A7W4H285_9GAMM|nr:transporter substrate-binding domain-containing protein [Pseudomonas guryensis]MBB1518124.1 transporter substrate-binding domain-containing protein [Pseudomonas guryensis]
MATPKRLRTWLSALLSCLPMLAAAQDRLDNTYTVAFYEAGYLYSNGAGIDKDVVDELKKRGGYSFDYVERPRARIWKELEQGSLPMSVSGLRTAERDAFAFFIPYIAQKNMALVTDARYATADSLLQDAEATAAVVRGFKHGEYFDDLLDQLRAQGRVNEVLTAHNLFLMLKAGNRVDLIISQPVFYAKELNELGLNDSVIVHDWKPEQPPTGLGLILSKAHFSEQAYLEMKGLIDEMKADGTLRGIFLKYLPPQQTEQALDF